MFVPLSGFMLSLSHAAGGKVREFGLASSGCVLLKKVLESLCLSEGGLLGQSWSCHEPCGGSLRPSYVLPEVFRACLRFS